MALSFRFRTAACIAFVAASAMAIGGCQSIREATGAAKVQPNEFAVLTKGPLIVPPDFNLRPPQPGAPDRNTPAPGEAARAALFPVSGAAAPPGDDFSAGEKLLLAKSGGDAADPAVRGAVNGDAGIEDRGPEFTDRVLNTSQGAAPAAAR